MASLGVNRGVAPRVLLAVLRAQYSKFTVFDLLARAHLAAESSPEHRRGATEAIGSLRGAGAEWIDAVADLHEASLVAADELRWHNWMGNQSASPAVIERPGTLAELQAAIEHAAQEELAVRVFGSRHSWSALVPTDGMLIDVTKLRHNLPLRDGDPDGCIRVEAGMTVGRMLDAADRAGLYVPSTTVATNFTVGGLVATGSHGTGLAFATFSDNVVGMTIVTADGSVRESQAALRHGSGEASIRFGARRVRACQGALGSRGPVPQPIPSRRVRPRLGRRRAVSGDRMGWLDPARAERHSLRLLT